MRRVATFLLAAGLVLAVAHPASAAPPSSDPTTAARFAAAWLAHQVSSTGFIPQAANPANANLSVSAQAVPALAAAGVGKSQVDALLAYLGHHVNDLVASAGADDPAALANLILAAEAAAPTRPRSARRRTLCDRGQHSRANDRSARTSSTPGQVVASDYGVIEDLARGPSSNASRRAAASPMRSAMR